MSSKFYIKSKDQAEANIKAYEHCSNCSEEPPAIAFQYLWDEQVKQLEHQMKAGAVWTNPDDLVFANERGTHYMPATFYKRYKVIAASIGRPDTRPHDLRHTAAAVAIASGSDITSVQNMLDHATASFTPTPLRR